MMTLSGCCFVIFFVLLSSGLNAANTVSLRVTEDVYKRIHSFTTVGSARGLSEVVDKLEDGRGDCSLSFQPVTLLV